MNGLIIIGLIAAVSCNDLIQGPKGGKKIYDENKEASPAIWRRNDEVTFKTNETDVIRRIVITDLRPDKDGEAKILEGGEGKKNVTLQLKSPTALRGYDFHIEVYAVSENEQGMYEPEGITEAFPEVTMFDEAVMENDTIVNVQNSTVSDTSMTEDREVLPGQEKVPILTDRKAKTMNMKDPIAQYVNEKVTTEESKPPKSYSLLKVPAFEDKEKTASETKNQKETTTVHEANERDVKVIPMHSIIHDHINEDKVKTTAKNTYTTEQISERDLKHFRDISKELGENVVFGIKRV